MIFTSIMNMILYQCNDIHAVQIIFMMDSLNTFEV